MSLFGFLKPLGAFLHQRALQSGAHELDEFVKGLVATGDRSLGALLAIATVVRVNLEAHQVVPEGVFWNPPDDSEQLGLMQVRINGIIRQFLKEGNGVDATACRLWSLSLRCMNVPEYRDLGRAIWAEMRRGHPYVEAALRAGEETKGGAFDSRVWDEWRRAPSGLEPAPR